MRSLAPLILPPPQTMIPFISSEQRQTVLPFPELIDALRTAFQEQDYAQANGDTALANMDGRPLNLRQAAARSALASSYLSRANSRRLLIIGTGELTPDMALAHCAVRSIEQVSLWGPTAEEIEQTLLAIRSAGLPHHIQLTAAGDLHEALISVDIVCAIGAQQTPLIEAASVCPGTHVDLVAGSQLDMREADDDLMRDATIFLDTVAGAVSEAGDLLQPVATGLIAAGPVQGELADLACGRHAGRINSWQVTIFQSADTVLHTPL